MLAFEISSQVGTLTTLFLFRTHTHAHGGCLLVPDGWTTLALLFLLFRRFLGWPFVVLLILNACITTTTTNNNIIIS